jgi:hypothetical protein
MAICPSGHQTNQADFCDVCGLPLAGSPQAPTPASTSDQASISCPHCAAVNVAEALFCESCGYDFTTGSMPAPAPAPAWPTLTPVPAPEPTPVPQPLAAPEQPRPTGQPTAPDAAATAAVTTPGDAALAATPAASLSVVPDPVATAQPKARVEWVAEMWIDPDWYAAQGSTDPMPSVGLPDIVGLVKPSNLLGRVSHSRGIFPDIDCEMDSGCSRRHAMLTTDWTRWWIEDLNSANGTFVGAAAGPLPAMPIPQGRVELAEGQRIYIGAWTRIVVRRATTDEQAALTS